MSLLSMQYRMAPTISRWPSTFFYGGRMRDGPKDNTCAPPTLPYFWLASSSYFKVSVSLKLGLRLAP